MSPEDFERLLNDPDICAARGNLTKAIRKWTKATVKELGFRYRPSPNPPADLDDLEREFRVCKYSGLPLRVTNRWASTTIFISPEEDYRFRFLQSVFHVWLRADFDRPSKLIVAAHQLTYLQDTAGFDEDSLECRLFYADAVGQAWFEEQTGVAATNVLRFALRCLDQEMMSTIADEFRVQSAEGPGQ